MLIGVPKSTRLPGLTKNLRHCHASHVELKWVELGLLDVPDRWWSNDRSVVGSVKARSRLLSPQEFRDSKEAALLKPMIWSL